MIDITEDIQRDRITITEDIQRDRVTITEDKAQSPRGKLVFDFRQGKHMIAAATIQQIQ